MTIELGLLPEHRRTAKDFVAAWAAQVAAEVSERRTVREDPAGSRGGAV